MHRSLLGPLLASSLGVMGCTDESTFVAPIPPPRDAGCVVGNTSRTFDIYFVVDVSRSMQAFLSSLAQELSTFALGFPETDQQGNRVLVSYYVVAFVNDVRLFPDEAERMTSHIAVSAAIRAAIDRAQGNRNLNVNTQNVDDEENLLDALGAVIDRAPSADSVLVLVATDQSFPEAPASLSGGITVTRTYEEVFSGLQGLGARVHAFVPGAIDGLTRPFGTQPPFTTLQSGQIFDLNDLSGAEASIRATLEGIARDATCNPAVGADL